MTALPPQQPAPRTVSTGPGLRPRPAPEGRRLPPRRALTLVSLAAVLANSAWFSATAVVPQLESQWHLTATGAAWLAIVVQAGFVTGSVGAALLNLPDRLQPRRVIGAAAVIAGLANLGLLAAHGLTLALPLRFVVGVALAGVYAPGVRLVASYYRKGRGLATGVIVGALTLGSGTPHLVRGVSDIPWQATIVATSVLAVLAALVISPVRPGPDTVAAPPLDLGAAGRALVRHRPLRLVTIGYLGHMWELYALWTWVATYVAASRGYAAGSGRAQELVVFLAVGVAGMLGSVAAGRTADLIGRTATTSGAMLLSAGCCFVSPLVFTASQPFLLTLLLVWGAAVIADSAQFSAATTELAEARYAGSALALQLALGFALTVVSIRLVPVAAHVTSWRFALMPLGVGPLLGTGAMLRLRTSPAARQLAGGRR